MPFPVTPILDTFSRADENPVANGWSGPFTIGDPQLKIVSNSLVTNSTGGNSYWSASQFGPDCECYVTLTSALAAGQQVFVHARGFPQAGATGGYAVKFFNQAGDDLVTIEKDGSQIGSTIDYEPNIFGAGDGFGMSVIGDSIRAYYRITTGAWTDIGGTTDSTYTGANYIGITIIGAAVTLDDFGGGTIGGGPGDDPPFGFSGRGAGW